MARKLHLICPICGKNRRIALPPDVFNNDEGYLLKVPIHKGTICEHPFIAVLDYRFSVRDYIIPNAREYDKFFMIPNAEPQFGELFDLY